MDCLAKNYNPRAVSDDGSCAYSTVIFNPEFLSLLPKEVDETSGLFFYGGKLWTHNDSGGEPILYALDTSTFDVDQRVTLSNANNVDWEDVCFDGSTVFVGDFGNNMGARDDLKIYTFSVQGIPEGRDALLTVDTISFEFADQTDFSIRTVHDFDCEAMFATERYLYLFSKGWETGTTRLYRLSKQAGHQVAEVVNWFDSKGLVTGADYNPETGVIAIVGYVNKIWEPFLFVLYDFDEEALTAHGRRLDMPNLMGTQTEGICFIDAYRCYISAETSPAFSTRIFRADLKKWTCKDEKAEEKR